MAKSENQKTKLLLLLEIFSAKSDEEHPLTVADLQRHLAAYGVRAERKTLYDDMESLRTLGYDIVSLRSKTTGYYLAARRFELAELKLLVDAVQSSRFITKKKSDELIGKLSAEVSEYEAASLKRQVHIAGRVKTMNESIYYNVDLVHTAIRCDKKIRFHYFGWNAKKERVLRHDGAFYEVSPFALTWDDENYYLIAYDSDVGDMRHYRVDKMLHLSVGDREREGKACFEKVDLGSYSTAVFGMFGGNREGVRLRVAEELVGVMIDRFGTDIEFFPCENEGWFDVNVSVAVSPNFLSWVIGFGSKMKVIAPDGVVQRLQELTAEALMHYR